MNRTARSITALTAALALAALPGFAQAGRRATRTESGTYYAGGIQGVIGVNSAAQESVGGVRLTGGAERFVSISVEDATGLPISGEIGQNLDSDASPEISYMFCGATEKPVKINPNVEVFVYLYEGTCGTDPSLPTSGEVVAEFSAKR